MIGIHSAQTNYSYLKTDVKINTEINLNKAGETEQQNKAPMNQNAREELITFIQSATPSEAHEKLENIKSGPPLPYVNLRQVMESPNQEELLEKFDRISKSFRSILNDFHELQVNLIDKGHEEGKTPKEILKGVIDLYDSQDSNFKLAIGWEGKPLSDKENHSKILAMGLGCVNECA